MADKQTDPSNAIPPELDPASLHNGCVLVARDELEDLNFKASVVLVCAYSDQGAFGLVLNRPSHMPLTEVFNLNEPHKAGSRTIYIGGPVQQEALQVLQMGDTPTGEALPIADGVFLGGEWNSVDEILGEQESRLRLFLGYAGWGADQLENEIRLGAWYVVTVPLGRLLAVDDEQLRGTSEQLLHFLQSLGE